MDRTFNEARDEALWRADTYITHATDQWIPQSRAIEAWAERFNAAMRSLAPVIDRMHAAFFPEENARMHAQWERERDHPAWRWKVRRLSALSAQSRRRRRRIRRRHR